MTKELYISGELVDLGEGTVIATTLQAHDLTALASRSGDRTNKFKLPPTMRNRRILGLSDQVMTSSLTPYRKLPARLVLDGAELVSNGYAILEQVKDGFEVAVYSGNLDFFNLIEGLQLRDLDLSAYDHDWTLANVMASWTNTTGYKYPLIDYGGAEDVFAEYDALWFRTAFFFDTLVRKIFAEQNYTVTGSLLTRADYLKTMLLFGTEGNDELFTNSFGAQITYEAWTAIDFAVGAPLAWVNVKDTIGPTNGNVDEQITLRMVITNTNPFSLAQFVKVYVSDPFTTTYTLMATVSGNGIHSVTLDLPNSGTVYQRSLLFEVKECWVEVLDGRVAGVGTTDPTKYYSASVIKSPVLQAGGISKYAWAGLAVASDALPFGTTAMQRYAPSLSQKDFLVAVMNMFCAFPITDSLTREVRLVTLADVQANKAVHQDWTAKAHWDPTTHALTFRRDAFGQLNRLEYTEDSVNVEMPPKYGRGTIPVDDQTLPTEKTVITLPFAASTMVAKLADGVGQPTVYLPLVRLLEDEEFKQAVVPRVLVDDTQDIGYSIDFLEAGAAVSGIATPASANIPLCYFQLLTKAYNLGFDSSLGPDNYQELEAILNPLKAFQLLFNLNMRDVLRFDFSVPIWLDQVGADFYVNKINNFQPGKLTSLDLIKV